MVTRRSTQKPRTQTLLTLVALASLVALAVVSPASAQSIDKELTPQVGWQWGGTLNYPAGDIHINSAINYGGTLSFGVRPGYYLELSYSYQNAEVIGRPRGAQDFKFMDLSTQYIQLQGRRDLKPPTQKAVPFLLGGLGTTVFSPSNTPLGASYETQWLFAMTAGGGVKVNMNPKTALRLQARMLLPINWVSGGFYFGSGGGGATISGGSAIIQGDVSLGLVMKLGGAS